MGKGSSKPEDFGPSDYSRSKSKSVHTISKPKSFKKHINVKIDENGKLVGMPELWVDLLKISPEMVEYTINVDELDENVKPIEPDENILNAIQSLKPGKFTIYTRNKIEGESCEYNVELDEHEEMGIKGLPDSWDNELREGGLTKKDVQDNPLEVLETLDCISRSKTGSLHPLPTNSEYRKLEEKSIVFIKSDPSENYIILDELGEGGFGKVYKTVKIEDQQYYAMKHIDITCAKQKIYIGNEITLMKSMDHKNIVKLYETYMYKGRIFLFMEYLDGGCLTPIVEELQN